MDLQCYDIQVFPIAAPAFSLVLPIYNRGSERGRVLHRRLRAFLALMLRRGSASRGRSSSSTTARNYSVAAAAEKSWRLGSCATRSSRSPETSDIRWRSPAGLRAGGGDGRRSARSAGGGPPDGGQMARRVRTLRVGRFARGGTQRPPSSGSPPQSTIACLAVGRLGGAQIPATRGTFG